MGICRYCHQKAGWFSDAHAPCVDKATQGIEALKSCIANAVITNKNCGFVQPDVDALIESNRIPQQQVLLAIKEGWSLGAEKRCKAQPVDPAECDDIRDIYRPSGLTDEDVFKTPGNYAMVFSSIIWSILNDCINPLEGPVNFNLRAGELPVIGVADVRLSEQCTTSSYVGAYQGVSMRVASGLYYRLGAMRGHKVSEASLQDVDYGNFLMTTQAVYFGGTEKGKGVNFRLPYSSVVRFVPYSDAVGICKNGGREQIFAPQYLADSGWWLFNTLQALAAKALGRTCVGQN